MIIDYAATTLQAQSAIRQQQNASILASACRATAADCFENLITFELKGQTGATFDVFCPLDVIQKLLVFTALVSSSSFVSDHVTQEQWDLLLPEIQVVMYTWHIRAVVGLWNALVNVNTAHGGSLSVRSPHEFVAKAAKHMMLGTAVWYCGRCRTTHWFASAIAHCLDEHDGSTQFMVGLHGRFIAKFFFEAGIAPETCRIQEVGDKEDLFCKACSSSIATYKNLRDLVSGYRPFLPS